MLLLKGLLRLTVHSIFLYKTGICRGTKQAFKMGVINLAGSLAILAASLVAMLIKMILLFVRVRSGKCDASTTSACTDTDTHYLTTSPMCSITPNCTLQYISMPYS